MGKNAPRRVDNLTPQLPLPSERREVPWFGGAYVDVIGELVFDRDGTARFDGESGSWSVEARLLRVSTATCHCEGALGPEGAYLQCTSINGSPAVAERALEFRAP